MIRFLQLTPGEDADAVREAMARVVTRGWFILGPELEAFEQEFAAYCGSKYCVGVGNGLEALHLLLHLQRLHREAGRFQHPAHARLVVGEAGHAAGLLPLVDVEGHHGQATPGGESGAGPLHDGVRGTEMGGDELGVPWVVGDALHVGLVELDVGEASRGRPSSGITRAS